MLFLGVASSFLIVAFGQPSGISLLGLFASMFGYGLFWKSVLKHPNSFYISWVWFGLIQAVQLEWMTSITYQGVYILFVYGALCVLLGLAFAYFTSFLQKIRKISCRPSFAFAALWTLFEWGRMHFLCGLSWNLAGVSLSVTQQGLQMAALFGVLGMSFWVIYTNLLSVEAWRHPKVFLLCASLPYLFGYAHISIHQSKLNGSKKTKVGLVQTGLLPSQKIPLVQDLRSFIPAINQWQKIFAYLGEHKEKEFHLIAFPEAAVPFGADQPLYFFEDAKFILEKKFKGAKLPPLQMPFAKKQIIKGEERWTVTNLFFAQTVANYFNSDVIIGLEDCEEETGISYNAAFLLRPNSSEPSRYEKRILLPLAEYLPFKWLKRWTASYGLTDFFTHGKEAKILEGSHRYSVSICYEETFPDLMREGGALGASLFVNVTSDSWYPFSTLPSQHYEHGLIRAVENGVPLVRSCNTGITGAVDSLGKKCGYFGEGKENFELLKGVFVVDVNVYSYPTLYKIWGDWGILVVSIFGMLVPKLRRGLALKLRLG